MPAATECDRLLARYRARIRTDPRLGRPSVSFQANRNARYFGWFKYREAFSAQLAAGVIDRFTRPGDVVLDPFAGAGTAVFCARSAGRRAIGIELLPVGVAVMEARLSAERVRASTLARHVEAAAGLDWADLHDPDHALRHIAITAGAFPEACERALAGYRAWCARLGGAHVRRLFHLAAMSVLEQVSYTRKDGQYLRWDGRAVRPGGRHGSGYRKSRIVPFPEAVRRRLEQIRDDLEDAAAAPAEPLDLRQGSCLDLLPRMDDASVDLALTSPPYCNRYDYTRTYALELVYLGLGADDVKRLRQAMLSCTVENARKTEAMEAAYDGRGRRDAFARAAGVFGGQAALHEVLDGLDEEARLGRLNNPNVPRMVRNYFFEMCFVVLELARILRPGGRIVMVNDNVRYSGIEIPVDLVLGDFAGRLGLEVERIWTLPRGKGNSSQQMGAHGRRELRKCVYVWRKP